MDVSAKVGCNKPGTNCGDEFRPPSEAERLPDDVNTRGQLKLSRLTHHELSISGTRKRYEADDDASNSL